MSDPNFPGFADDAAPAPAPAPKPAPKAPTKAPAASYELDMGEPEAEPKKRFAAPQPQAEAAPSASPVTPVAAPTQRKTQVPAPDTVPDEDIKPGARKDLWACPHCGTKNQPQRSTCRSCGKSASDEVVIPAWKRPPVMAGIAAGVVLVIVLIVAMSGTDLSLREATADQVDKKLRIGSGHGAARDLAVGQFIPNARVAVCGRVVASSIQSGVVNVVLVLGSAATDDEAINASNTTISDGRVQQAPETSEFLNLCFSNSPPTIAKGSWLSLVGERGEVADRTDLGGTVIAVTDYKQ